MSKLTIVAGQEMGLFPLDVYAKPQSDVEFEDDYKLVKEVPVTITAPLSYTPSKCITVSPTTVDFTTSIQGWKQVEVLNTCYDQGYRLAYLMFKDLSQLRVPVSKYFSDKLEETPEYISFLSVTTEQGMIQPMKTRLGTTSDGKHVEIWTIELRRNPDITQYVAEKYIREYGFAK